MLLGIQNPFTLWPQLRLHSAGSSANCGQLSIVFGDWKTLLHRGRNCGCIVPVILHLAIVVNCQCFWQFQKPFALWPQLWFCRAASSANCGQLSILFGDSKTLLHCGCNCSCLLFWYTCALSLEIIDCLFCGVLYNCQLEIFWVLNDNNNDKLSNVIIKWLFMS